MKNRNNVEFNEKLSINQMIEGLLQLRNKISVFNNDVVKFLIIHTYLNIFPRFINKDHWEADEECAEMYKFFLKVFIQLLFKYFKLINNYEIQRTVF